MHKQEDAEAVETAEAVEPAEAAESAEAAEPTEAVTADDSVTPEAEVEVSEPVEVRTTHEVAIVRTVRIGPIMVASAVIFALTAAIIALMLPVQAGENYTAGQAAGFVIVPGAALGLLVGGVLALILARIAKRKQGAAIAVRTDVR